MRLTRHDSIVSLHDTVHRLTDDGKIDRSLVLIHDLVERIITDPLCTSQVFGSKKLDELFQYIGRVSLNTIRHEPVVKKHGDKNKLTFVYVVTKLQKWGGHTRVIEDFITSRRGGLHYILSTELDGSSDFEHLNSVLANRADVVLEKAPKTNYQQRLIWLQTRLLELSPQKVYLFNHHQDSVAVAAIQPEMELDVTFYHHGDHHLCLGVYVAHFKHIDAHPMGYHNCREVLGLNNIYLPLTVEDKGRRPDDVSFMQNGTLTTCTAARYNKIEIPYFVSYVDTVPQILNSTGGKHIHIGKLTPWALYMIRRGLRKYGIRRDRFVYIPWVPSVWEALQRYQVDLYVASFPYGGGLTLIEAMGAGIPVALHRHIFSRILSCTDLAYPRAFSWRYTDELLNYCASVTTNQLAEAGKSGRIHFERYYSGNHLQHFLNHTDQYSLTPDSLSGDFSVEADEWALWMEGQMNFRRLFARTVYRSLKRLRAKCARIM